MTMIDAEETIRTQSRREWLGDVFVPLSKASLLVISPILALLACFLIPALFLEDQSFEMHISSGELTADSNTAEELSTAAAVALSIIGLATFFAMMMLLLGITIFSLAMIHSIYVFMRGPKKIYPNRPNTARGAIKRAPHFTWLHTEDLYP